jgi:lipopolysaccharide export system protein LptC
MNTEYLLVLPDDDVLMTDKPFEMMQDRITMSGVGMKLNNITRDFAFHGKVHTVVLPMAP